MTSQRVLVTGSTGVVGHALRAIRDELPQYEFLFSSSRDCDLRDLPAVVAYVRAVRPDAIVHLAALSGGIGLSLRRPATILRDNVLMSVAVLEAARLGHVGKTVMTLSTGMYPTSAPLPIREESIHDGYPHASNYAYAFAKRLVDPLVRAYREEYGISVIGVVPNGIFGEHDCFNWDDATVVAALIRRFCEHRHTHEPIVIWGDGSPFREFTHAHDIARAYIWCLEHYDEAQILHIGTTEEHSVREIAHMIADILGIERRRIVFDTSKPSGQPRKSTDNSRFVDLSGFRYTPFRLALAQTVRWYCETMERSPAALRLGSKVKTD